MSTATERDFDALLKELNNLRADMTKLSDVVQKTVRSAGDDVLSEARARGQKAWSQAESHAEDILEQIEAKPLQSALIAFAIGAFLGFLFGGRR
jgi:ElaB/YqjD/DUF883 family membrane-anchored ribosome-binding protein